VPLARNPWSIGGAVLTTVAAVGFVTFVALDAFGLITGPYADLLGVLLLPAVFLVGLALIPFGMWREGRRRRRGGAAWAWPAVDLNRRRTRVVVASVIVLTLVNLGIVAVASVGAAHYTESNQFCGAVCHTPMTPEFTAHRYAPHAEVDCVSCHIGPGASGAVRAKLNGTRQLYLLTTGAFHRPIPEPVDRIPHAAETCAHCHTPGRPTLELTRTFRSYGDDETNSETATALTLHMAANHWHAQAGTVVEYVATDATNATIPYVRVTDGHGQVVEYLADGVAARPSGPLHRMDCLDCHNRPAHTFSAAPDKAVDAAMASGDLGRDLPFLHREAVAALSKDYPSQAAADVGIAAHLRSFYKASDPASVDRAVAAVEQIYRRNVFPEMKVGWGTYANQLDHVATPGCFRCHDDSHKSRDGKSIRQDCELCHHVG
jgi:hypothetical protein